jgi:hypothetical protein
MEISDGRVGIAFTEYLDVFQPGPRPGPLVYTQSPSGRSARTDSADPGARDAGVHALAFSDGRPRVIYRRNYDDPTLVESVADASYAFGPPAVVLTDGAPLQGSVITTGAGGHQAVLYVQGDIFTDDRVFAGTRAPGNSFEVQQLGKEGDEDGVAHTGAPAVAPNGVAFVGWAGPAKPATFSGSLSLPGKPFAKPRAIASTSYDAGAPDVDVNSGGTAALTWEDGRRIRVAFQMRDGRVTGPARLANLAGVEPISIDRPAAAIDDRGRVVVLYRVGNDVVARRAMAP